MQQKFKVLIYPSPFISQKKKKEKKRYKVETKIFNRLLYFIIYLNVKIKFMLDQ